MPYASNDDLPPDVRERFSARCQTVWREAWNDTYKRTSSEKRAFPAAEAAGANCKKATASRTDTMPALAIKTLQNGDSLIEGFLAPFDGPAELGFKDLHAQRFTSDTDFALEWFGDWQRPLLYDHGLDGTIKTDVVGRIALEPRPKGIWMKAELEKANEYHDEIAELVGSGKMGLSSGSLAHLVRVSAKTGEVLRWPIVEGSLTPEPANPLAVAGYSIKRAAASPHVLAVIKDAGDLPDPNPLKWSESAFDASSGAQVLSQLYALLGQESDEVAEGEGGTAQEQVDLLTSAVDSIEQWIALESDEIGSPEEQSEDLQPAVMSYAIRGWRHRARPATKAGARNSQADQDRIQAIHDHASALGASHGEGESKPAATAEKTAEPAVPLLGVMPGNGAVKEAGVSDEIREALTEHAIKTARSYLGTE